MGVVAVVALVGAAIGAAQQKQAGAERKDFANYQADQSTADAQAVRDQGELNATALRKQGRRQQAAANVALVASGVGLGSPGAININEDIRTASESDALNAIINGDRSGKALESQATALRIGGKQAAKAANIQATSTLVSAAGSAYSGWYTSSAQPASNSGSIAVNQSAGNSSYSNLG